MISAEHRDRVKRVIDEASGGRLLHGGAIPTRGVPAGGHYLEPTVYADVPADSALAREELFGPVLALMPWHDETAMLDQIRGLDVGLTAAIWTADLSRRTGWRARSTPALSGSTRWASISWARPTAACGSRASAATSALARCCPSRGRRMCT